MGIHSGPVNQVIDVNDRSNFAGAGINIAQRVLDCGDAGHILLSKHVADTLGEYRHWQPYLHDLGECEVKHGLRLHVVNLCKENLGNPRLPEKLKRSKRWKPFPTDSVSPIRPPRFSTSALVVAVVLSALALALSFFIFFHRPLAVPRSAGETFASPLASVSDKSIAVLPFENLSDNRQNAFFTDGVQDEILNHLAKVADLRVISRTSVKQYKSGVPRKLREVAKELGVAHVVEGSVQRAGDRVRVTAQLIDARTDTHLWAEHYDRELADVFRIQTEIAEQIVSQLQARLSPQEKASIEERPTHDLAAYDLYLQRAIRTLFWPITISLVPTTLSISWDWITRQSAWLWLTPRWRRRFASGLTAARHISPRHSIIIGDIATTTAPALNWRLRGARCLTSHWRSFSPVTLIGDKTGGMILPRS
jgi:TolB-like protein